MGTFLTLSEADAEITRLKAHISSLEDQALRDDAEIGHLREALRAATGQPHTARTVPEDARAAIRQAVETFHARMDEHEAEARALGVEVDVP